LGFPPSEHLVSCSGAVTSSRRSRLLTCQRNHSLPCRSATSGEPSTLANLSLLSTQAGKNLGSNGVFFAPGISFRGLTLIPHLVLIPSPEDVQFHDLECLLLQNVTLDAIRLIILGHSCSFQALFFHHNRPHSLFSKRLIGF
jgi:hypothetical protein